VENINMEQEKLNNGCLYLYKKGPPEEVLTVDVIKDIYKTEVIIREDPISSRPYINSHLKLTPFKKRYRASIMDL